MKYGERGLTAPKQDIGAPAALKLCMHVQETAEAASRPAEEPEGGVRSGGGSDSSLSHTASSAGADSAAEMARFGAAKERKHSMEAGIALFNRCVVSLDGYPWLPASVRL